jgi:hypothetical protein
VSIAGSFSWSSEEKECNCNRLLCSHCVPARLLGCLVSACWLTACLPVCRLSLPSARRAPERLSKQFAVSLLCLLSTCCCIISSLLHQPQLRLCPPRRPCGRPQRAPDASVAVHLTDFVIRIRHCIREPSVQHTCARTRTWRRSERVALKQTGSGQTEETVDQPEKTVVVRFFPGLRTILRVRRD